MMYDTSGVTVVISKSSFLPEELERRISRGYCRCDRPSSIYVHICWAGGLILGQPVVRGRVNVVMGVHVSE